MTPTDEYQRQRHALLSAGATLRIGGQGVTQWAEAEFPREPGQELRQVAKAAGYVVIVRDAPKSAIDTRV